MSSESTDGYTTPRWLHLLAILMAVATVPLLALGGLVTTRQVGMSDPIWPTTPWYLFLISWQEPRPGFLIEHSHRLAAYVLGLLSIIFAIGMWRSGRGTRLRWLGLVCLVAVSIQGLLGGFRVVLNAMFGTNLATIHGCTGQIVFSIIIGAVVLTRSSRNSVTVVAEERGYWHRASIRLLALVLLQLVWGVMIRHQPNPVVQRLHILTAFLVVVVAAAQFHRAAAVPAVWSQLGRSYKTLASLLFLQVLLGVEAWMGKFASGILPELQVLTTQHVIIRTTHVLIGAGILGTAVTLFLQTRISPDRTMKAGPFAGEPHFQTDTIIMECHPSSGGPT